MERIELEETRRQDLSESFRRFLTSTVRRLNYIGERQEDVHFSDRQRIAGQRQRHFLLIDCGLEAIAGLEATNCTGRSSANPIRPRRENIQEQDDFLLTGKAAI